jgi:hypothetical protein
MEPTAEAFLARLHTEAIDEQRAAYRRFFPGDGSFLGVRTGTVSAIAKECLAMPLCEIEKLLESEVHEARACSVLGKAATHRTVRRSRRPACSTATTTRSCTRVSAGCCATPGRSTGTGSSPSSTLPRRTCRAPPSATSGARAAAGRAAAPRPPLRGGATAHGPGPGDGLPVLSAWISEPVGAGPSTSHPLRG